VTMAAGRGEVVLVIVNSSKNPQISQITQI
jgi:hypothetical protein